MKPEFDITLEQVKDYTFTVTFDDESLPHITIDEPAPIGTGEGPSSSRLLATAVGHERESTILSSEISHTDETCFDQSACNLG